MSRGFIICMAKGRGGRGSFRPSYRHLKLTLISRDFAIAVSKKTLWNEIESAWTQDLELNADSISDSILEQGFNILKLGSNTLQPQNLFSKFWKGMKRESSDKTRFWVSREGQPIDLGTLSSPWFTFGKKNNNMILAVQDSSLEDLVTHSLSD